MKTWNTAPPNCPETEMAVLGAVLLDNECLEALPLKPAHFYTRANQVIFAAMLEIQGPIDVVTLAKRLGKKELKSIGGAMYLSGLSDACVTSANVESYAAILVDMAKRREMIKACLEIASEGAEQKTSISQYLSVSRNKIVSLIDDTSDLADSVTATDAVAEAYEQAIGDEPQGLVPTGIGRFDREFGGMWPGLLTVLASRPSMGKSCLALNIVANACLKGKRVLLLSLEDTRTFVNWRLMARFADVSLDKILRRDLNKEERSRLEKAKNIIKCFELRIVDRGGMTSEHIKRTCLSHANKYGCDMVVIDHLGHINEPGKSLYEATSNAARTIASIAPDLNIPVLLLHQLNRGTEYRETPLPKLADLRQSGEVEQLARAVWLLYRPGYYDKDEDPNELSLIVAKNSHGATNMLQLYCDMPMMYIGDSRF